MKFQPLGNEPVPLNSDPWLAPFREKLRERSRRAVATVKRLTGGKSTLAEFASGHEYFGLHFRDGEWVFREWAPNAARITLFGDFSDWRKLPEYRLNRLEHGVWELRLPAETLRHGMHYLLFMEWPGGSGDRIPAYARCVNQDKDTGLFAAVVWRPEQPYVFRHASPPAPAAPLIYESHVGMAQEEPKVGSFDEYREKILPKIAASGYNTIQLMAVMGHPYYGSFGYHVANFFAIASRFGTPDEFKALVDAAHGCGLRVIIDLVHSHAVKNEVEGLAKFDGTRYAYFHEGSRGEHSGWDSLCFNYAKPEVLHFLLSNCRFYLDEYRVDGFRFDGVTSMLYRHHGYIDFDCRDRYFDEGVNEDAVDYLTLANRLVHDFRPAAVTIAEDVSGMPGMCIPIDDGGIGFDYRLGMAIPDYWIKQLKEVPDEEWNIWEMWSVMTNRLPGVKTVAYAESHDQALVGDKTLAFRLMDKEMYFHMDKASENIVIDRGMALHKMIRLMTISTGGQAYLNFMGNEFGHPEWIDFPREGNGWSYAHARRQWSLAKNGFLRYAWLGDFDRAMIRLVKKYKVLADGYPWNLLMDERNKTMAFSHGDLLFVFNWHPSASIPDYELPVQAPGKYVPVLSTDESRFGGQERQSMAAEHFSFDAEKGDGQRQPHIRIYNTSRTATVYLRKK